MKDSVTKAVEMMKQGRKWLQELNVSAPVIENLVGFFEVNLVHHVTHKVCKDRNSYKSLEEVCSAFVDQVFKVETFKAEAAGAPAAPFARLDFKPVPPVKKTSKEATKAVVREFVDGKLTMGSLNALGFKLGALTPDGGTTVLKIVSMDDSKTKLEHTTGGDGGAEENTSELPDKYTVENYKEATYLKSDDLADPLQHTEAVATHWKNIMSEALRKAFEEARMRAFVIQKEPIAKVFVTAAVQKDAKLFVPFNFLVNSCMAKDVPSQGIAVGPGYQTRDGTKFQPYVVKRETYPVEAVLSDTKVKHTEPFVVPFWSIREVKSESEANLKNGFIEVSVDGEKVKVPCLTAKWDIEEGMEVTVVAKIVHKAGANAPAPKGRLPKGAGKLGKAAGPEPTGASGAEAAAATSESAVGKGGRPKAKGSKTGKGADSAEPPPPKRTRIAKAWPA